MAAALFGQRTARLSETLGSTHWLLYLLVITSSITSVLVLGHSQIPLLFSADWGVRIIVAAAFFVLVATVYAADLCFLKTMARIPALARNRETTMQVEYMLYMLFVLAVECGTYGVVIWTFDCNPHALLDPAPLLPTTGAIFLAIIGGRIVLFGWTLIQLSIVSRKMAPQLTTLMGTGREIVGAHVEHGLAALDLQHMTLAGAFRVYAAMSQPPRRVKTWLNGWLVRRDAHREAEEQRQAGLVLEALRELDTAQKPEASEEASEPLPPGVPMPTPFTPDGVWLPTGPGTPSAMPIATHPGPFDQTIPPGYAWESAAESRSTQAATVVVEASIEDIRKASREAALWASAQVLLNANPLMSRGQLRKELGCRQETASGLYSKWYYSGGSALIAAARRESAATTRGKVAQLPAPSCHIPDA
jgi:hypothetical protein